MRSQGNSRASTLTRGCSSTIAVLLEYVQQKPSFRETWSLLKSVPKTAVFQDDILIMGCDTAEHLSNLEEVLHCLDKVGLRLKREKCVFMTSEVVFLGRRVTAAGIMPCDSKVDAIKNAPKPENVSQLRSFLGLLNHFGSFLPWVSTVQEPLHQLLRKGKTWVWGKAQDDAFKEAKGLLCSNKLLVHYDP